MKSTVVVLIVESNEENDHSRLAEEIIHYFRFSKGFSLINREPPDRDDDSDMVTLRPRLESKEGRVVIYRITCTEGGIDA